MLLSTAPSPLFASTAPAAKPAAASAALLLPVTGPAAAIGLSMQRAAGLARLGEQGKAQLPLFDTGHTADTAAEAAARARAAGASVILGPLLASQVAPVAAAAGIPVISFSNSMAALGGGAFVFGITPSQSVSAILQYARATGVRRLVLLGSASAWSEQALKAAKRAAPEIGLQVVEAPAGRTASGADLLQALDEAEGGLPDAALLMGEGEQFAAIGRVLQQAGVQVLGTMQALDRSAAGLTALEGAWISAPDPSAFDRIAGDYRAFHGNSPPVIAALAFDAAQIVSTLTEAGQLNREGLLRSAGFPGVAGAVRFRPDGRCVRELAILTVTSGAVRTVGRRAGL